ncbi:MAG: type IX secretion system protein PorQ [Bacteroidales bacterium]
MNRRTFILLLFFPILLQNLQAQVGGGGAYSFLNLAITPRNAALGGKVVTLDESDLGIVLNNPAHLNQGLSNNLSLTYVSYFADIKYGFVTYAKHIEGVGTFGVGMQHVDYGDFIKADEVGQVTGSFTGYDMAINLLYSYSIDSVFTFGINLKPVYSHLEQYTSFGICTDVGATYHHPNRLLTAGLVARNIGTMIKPYTSDTWEDMPFELVAGVSQKLQHAPFRFAITFQQINTGSLYYKRETQAISFFDEPEEYEASFFERAGNELISHLVLGVEFIPVKNFYVRGGYNFQRRNELKVPEVASAAGFSWGIGVKIKKFHINYSRATYHLAGASNHFSVSTNLEEFLTSNNL